MVLWIDQLAVSYTWDTRVDRKDKHDIAVAFYRLHVWGHNYILYDLQNFTLQKQCGRTKHFPNEKDCWVRYASVLIRHKADDISRF